MKTNQTKVTTPKVEEYSYGYYSKALNKPFNTLDELILAEDEFNKVHEAEIKAKEQRKHDAEEIKSAITSRIETEVNARTIKQEAYKEYLTICDEEDKKVIDAKEKESSLLKSFCEKYPEGFHETIQYKDVSYKYDYNTHIERPNAVTSFFRLFDLL